MSKMKAREALKVQVMDAFALCTKELSQHPARDSESIVELWISSWWPPTEVMINAVYEAGKKGEPNPMDEEVEFERPDYNI